MINNSSLCILSSYSELFISRFVLRTDFIDGIALTSIDISMPVLKAALFLLQISEIIVSLKCKIWLVYKNMRLKMLQDNSYGL